MKAEKAIQRSESPAQDDFFSIHLRMAKFIDRLFGNKIKDYEIYARVQNHVIAIEIRKPNR